MCRVLSYLGKSILLEELLYKTDNSFIKQSYDPKYMSPLLNLAGFGIATWDKQSHSPELPFLYKTLQLPFYDENLYNFATKSAPSCLLAHLRGVSYIHKEIISLQNIHPFIFENSSIAFAHNGDLFDFANMKYDLLPYIKPMYQKNIKGTTDSEWMYSLFMSQLANKKNYTNQEILTALVDTLNILKQLRNKHHIEVNSPVNLFIANGEFIAAMRFVFDYGWEPKKANYQTQSEYHSLWYTFGERYGLFDNEYKMKGLDKVSSIIVASEPLTEDTSTWIEIPEYTMMIAEYKNDEIKITSQDINL